MDTRGQAFTIEGVIGAIVVASALVVGMSVVDIAQWTDDTSDSRERLRVQVADVLAAASDGDATDGNALRRAVTCIGGDGDPGPHPAVAAGGAPNDSERDALGTLLNRTLEAGGYQYRVVVEHNASADGSLDRTLMTPDRAVSGPSVAVTRHVVLFDSDPVYEFDADRGECVPVRFGNTTLAERARPGGPGIYLADQRPESELYAVVRVRVVAW